MKLLIFGGKGILGQCLEARFIKSSIDCHSVDLADLDISHPAEVEDCLERHQPTVVINSAAYTAVDACETEKGKAFSINAIAPGLIAEICRRRSIRMVHISTDYVFDGTRQTPYLETDPVSPRGIYAQSKAEGEANVMAAAPESLVIRLAWLFRSGGTNFLCKLRELILTQESIRVINDHTGNCTHAPDAAEAFENLIRIKASGTVHFTNEGSLTMYDFAVKLKEVAESMGLKPRCRKIIPVSGNDLKLAAPRPPCSLLDKSLYKKLTGKNIRHWHETLPDFLLQQSV